MRIEEITERVPTVATPKEIGCAHIFTRNLARSMNAKISIIDGKSKHLRPKILRMLVYNDLWVALSIPILQWRPPLQQQFTLF